MPDCAQDDNRKRIVRCAQDETTEQSSSTFAATRGHAVERGSMRSKWSALAISTSSTFSFSFFFLDRSRGSDREEHRRPLSPESHLSAGRWICKLHWVGVLIVIGNLGRFAPEEIDHGIIAEVQVEGTPKVDDAGERKSAVNGGFVRCQAKSKLAASRVSHDEDSAGIERIARDDLFYEAVSVADVFECAGPSAARIPYSSIFDVPGGAAFCGERGAEVASMEQVIFSTPIPAVNIHHRASLFLVLGQADIHELTGIGAVTETEVGGRRCEVQDVFGHGRLSCHTREPQEIGSAKTGSNVAIGPATQEQAQPPCRRPSHICRARVVVRRGEGQGPFRR